MITNFEKFNEGFVPPHIKKNFLNAWNSRKHPLEDDEIAKKILDYLSNSNVTINAHLVHEYIFTIMSGKKNENDPLGEEVWEDDVEIKVQRESEGFSTLFSLNYFLYVDDAQLRASDRISCAIYKLAEKKYYIQEKTRQENERDEKRRVALGKVNKLI